MTAAADLRNVVPQPAPAGKACWGCTKCKAKLEYPANASVLAAGTALGCFVAAHQHNGLEAHADLLATNPT